MDVTWGLVDACDCIDGGLMILHFGDRNACSKLSPKKNEGKVWIHIYKKTATII
jgi:hypothetical protein